MQTVTATAVAGEIDALTMPSRRGARSDGAVLWPPARVGAAKRSIAARCAGDGAAFARRQLGRAMGPARAATDLPDKAVGSREWHGP